MSVLDDSWPYVVRLNFKTKNQFDSGVIDSLLCGGTVIHQSFVLTAAHCCINQEGFKSAILFCIAFYLYFSINCTVTEQLKGRDVTAHNFNFHQKIITLWNRKKVHSKNDFQ